MNQDAVNNHVDSLIDEINKLKNELNEELKLRAQIWQEKEKLKHLIGSESVYTLLRYGYKYPSSSGMDDCEPQRLYMELYEISKVLYENQNKS